MEDLTLSTRTTKGRRLQEFTFRHAKAPCVSFQENDPSGQNVFGILDTLTLGVGKCIHLGKLLDPTRYAKSKLDSLGYLTTSAVDIL